MKRAYVDWHDVRDMLGSAVALALVVPLIAAFAFASTLPGPVERPAPATCRVSYVLGEAGLDGSAWSPLLFVQPGRDGTGLSVRPGDARVRSLLAVRRTAADFLDLPPSGLAVIPEPAPPAAAGSADRRRFEPHLEDAPVYPAARGESRALVVEAFGPAAFAPPADPDPALTAGAPWSATVSVSGRADGRVEHVFVTASSGRAEVDAALVRHLLKGRLAAGKRACCMRVSLVEGGRVEPAAERAGGGARRE